MWLIAFHGIALLTLIEALLIIWGTAMAVAIVFPWIGKRFFNASPAAAYRFAGLPLMTITGAVTTVFFAVAFVLLWKDKNAAGPLFDAAHRTELWIIVGTLAAGLIWYVGNKLYRRSQGVDIELAFRQIPIE
jgi:hypothetical protein